VVVVRNKKLVLIIATLAAAVGLFNCTDPPVAGTITQSGNGVVSGMVVDSGVPVSGARVMVIPVDYDPGTDIPLPDSLIDTTSASGGFNVTASIKTRYNVEVIHGSGKMALHFGVDIVEDNTLHVSDLAITLPGSISVTLYDTGTLSSAHVYIPGTTICSQVSGNTALLTNVPSGVIPQVRFRSFVTNTGRVVSNDVRVCSKETTVINDYYLWNYSRKIYFKTTVTGAGVSGDIINFPVLVRLTTDNFDFSQAAGDGSDIRFSKGNLTPLPFEVAQWDSAGKTAEIWVKVDTIYGNDSSHFMMMYWGNQKQTSVSSPEMVFDTGNGYLGVWHLGESGSSKVTDATSHHYDGAPSATAPSVVDGIAGKALRFNGVDNGIIMQGTGTSPLNFPRSGTYTFSSWVLVDSVYNEDSFIAGKGHDQYSLRVKGSLSTPSNMLAIHEYDDIRVTTDMRCLPVVMAQWKYITGIRNGEKLYFFVDGICVDSTGVVYDGKKTLQNSINFSIGRCAAPYNGENYLPFKGSIDEVSISGVARSADWIKLCYMNQSVLDKLLIHVK
jgi:hypothetical protein